ncbi:MAG: hypothetical protein L6V81_01220 [Clostridium sp.]|nr:MAG: hypothetical protein L6V81_01220 [Clostridium sp.]
MILKTHKVVTLNKDISWLPEFSSELYGYEVITNNEYEIVIKKVAMINMVLLIPKVKY